MAGKRQHYLPRLLQRGFLAPGEGGERTWLHRAGAPARLVGIKDVGTEDWFYSRRGASGELTLDDAITAFEQDLGKDVAILRTTPQDVAIEARLAVRTTVHLVMRTAHLRQTIESGIDGIVDEIEALFTDPLRLGAMMGVDSPVLGAAVMDAIRSTARDLVPAGFPAALSERLIAFFMRERGGELAMQTVAALTPMFPNLFEGLAERVRDGHNAIIATPLDDHGWVNALSVFHWTVEVRTDLILPDAVALVREAGGGLVPLLFAAAADAELVLLPVAHDRILIGRREAGTPVDLTDFNEQAAASCQSFFIAARALDAEGLGGAIGSGPLKALALSITEAVREAEKARHALGAGELPLAQPRTFSQQTFSYRVTLHDFGDDVLAKKYGAVLQAIVGALSRDIPLHELDGVTIAVDYRDALERLDRGDPDLRPATTAALGYGIGVAMPVTVVREGRRKAHLVLDADVAEGWTSEDASRRAFGLHLLIKMLAGIAHATRFADVPAFTPDAMGRELHLAVCSTPSAYWSAKQAAFVDPEQGERYRDLVITSLDFARSEVAASRARMADLSDMGEASMIALDCVSAVLLHAADWLGHRDGLPPGQPFVGDDLPARLEASGLAHWLALFGRDLAACYGADGSIDLAVVTALSRHVERLFWSLGVYVWPDGDDVRCVVSDCPLAPIVLPGIDVPAAAAGDADVAHPDSGAIASS